MACKKQQRNRRWAAEKLKEWELNRKKRDNNHHWQ